MRAPDPAVIRTGSAQLSPPCRQLRAGPLVATLEEGALRSIYLEEQEVLHGIYAAVRDQDWNTIPPRFCSYQVDERADAFLVSFVAEHRSAEVDFAWSGTIKGNSAGEITFTLDGQARRTFRKNRLGFCVLHPLHMGGAPLEVETPTGTITGVFPVHIAPHQPFKDIIALRYSCSSAEPKMRLELRFSGELFEMEDQRNWTDASYKTYCTPLRLPYPVELPAGARVVQSVTLRPLSAPTPGLVRRRPPKKQRSITVGTQGIGPLPELGFGLAQEGAFPGPAEADYLRALRPAHLWVELDMARADWEDRLVRACEHAVLLQADLDLSVVCDDAGRELIPLFQRLSERQIAVARLCCFSRATHVTTRAMVQQARVCQEATKVRMQLGAGSRANFAEFNRAVLPLDLVDWVTYPINPQVHAFDNFSLVETLPVQAITADNARRLAPELPLGVGPVTLKPRFNAVATSRVEPGELVATPACVDARQMSLFGAGWTVGSLRYLASAHVHWLTYFETTGSGGLLELGTAGTVQPPDHIPYLPGAVFPLYHVFADVAEFCQSTVLPVEISDPGVVEALALHQGRRMLLLIANLREFRQTVLLRFPHTENLLGRSLDETTALEAMYEPARFRQSKQPLIRPQARPLAIDLLPYAVMRIEGVVEPE